MSVYVESYGQQFYFIDPIYPPEFCVGQTVVVSNWDSAYSVPYNFLDPRLAPGFKLFFFFPQRDSGSRVDYPRCRQYRDTLMGIPFSISFADTGYYWMGAIIYDDHDSLYWEDIYEPFFHVIYCPPESRFIPSTQELCAGDCAAYQDTSGFYPVDWLWDFEGGSPSAYHGRYPPDICYRDTGTFTSRLIAVGKYSRDTSYQTLHVRDCNCLYIPNAFTPNGDGVNDTFRVYSDCQNREYQLAIYDRWGIKVFESHDLHEGWNGSCMGQPCPPGVYVYRLTSVFHSTDVIENTKGSITLIR